MICKIKNSIKKVLNGDYLPCTVLVANPLIVVAYEWDFSDNLEDFLLTFSAYKKIHLYLQLGWQHETLAMAEPLSTIVLDAMKRVEGLEITILTNSDIEEMNFLKLGVRAIYCHQNAFLDENRYPLKSGDKAVYDAIYIARITPFKRHQLVAKVNNLLLIGDWSEREHDYVTDTLGKIKHSHYKRRVPQRDVGKYINQAHCGLCLSAEEGAMFVSAEYMLCGIPVVSTANMGGREHLLPSFALKMVEDNEVAVAQGVEECKEMAFNPIEIRQAIIEKMKFFRTRFRSEITRVLNEVNEPEFKEFFLHKLGLRCTRMPWINWRYGLRRKRLR